MKKFNSVILLFVIGLGVYVGLSMNNEPPTIERSKKETLKEAVTVTHEKREEPNYQIIHSIKTRYDGGISYYVLLDSVDLNNSIFIDNVKYITNKLVNEKGKKISIEFFDDKNALELSYKQYGDLSLGRTLTEDENLHQEIHNIAGYSGDLKTDLYINTLYLFPAASSDHPQVGKYVSIMEYNPK